MTHSRLLAVVVAAVCLTATARVRCDAQSETIPTSPKDVMRTGQWALGPTAVERFTPRLRPAAA